MPSIALRAHYDGKQILLDENYELPPNAQLMVTVLVPQSGNERAGWASLSAQNLATAYGDDEPEYSASDVLQ
ncbi:MAG: hypothetical protein CO125_03045 [Hydrogenophilales bacterium CG_4_9_14_3_um_filter_59_35]|nr:MAG: hypothetical protein COW70_06440 [Hydrogenophilales bacterium CG18_big_fil_WC_8_21_14_2_50_58_12]PJB08007.1 MAG: hypothetical protein CO125_03045 [Hydrogenophilales bacterium CG_4_9_14_3_um_filter_59_35]